MIDCVRRVASARCQTCRASPASWSTRSHDLLFTSDREAARVSVFRCSDEQLLGRVAVGPHPNGLAYDRTPPPPVRFNLGEPLGENCTASVVDLDHRSVDG